MVYTFVDKVKKQKKKYRESLSVSFVCSAPKRLKLSKSHCTVLFKYARDKKRTIEMRKKKDKLQGKKPIQYLIWFVSSMESDENKMHQLKKKKFIYLIVMQIEINMIYMPMIQANSLSPIKTSRPQLDAYVRIEFFFYLFHHKSHFIVLKDLLFFFFCDIFFH